MYRELSQEIIDSIAAVSQLEAAKFTTVLIISNEASVQAVGFDLLSLVTRCTESCTEMHSLRYDSR